MPKDLGQMTRQSEPASLVRQRSVTLAHDYLTQRGGAERVFLSMARAFPDRPLLTTLYEAERTYPDFAELDVRPSGLQRIGLFRRNFRAALPFYPSAIKSMGPVKTDVLLSSSTAFAHGLEFEGCHIAYVHSPPHWLWESARYSGKERRGLATTAAQPLLSSFRRLDYEAAQRPHLLLTNSTHSAAKIREIYGRHAEVLPPPVRQRPVAAEPGDFFLVVARLLPYKRVDLAVQAANRLGVRLVVVGAGPELPRLQAMAGPTVEFMQKVPDAVLDHLYARCLGVIVAGEEDLGLVPIEANSAGRPAICWARGGALETVIDGRTGVLFQDPTVESLAEVMSRAAVRTWSADVLQGHAHGWSEEEFIRRLHLLVDRFPDHCRACGGEGLGPDPLAMLLAMEDEDVPASV